MKRVMLTAIGVVCAMPLFAQTVNATYYNPNGSYGGSSRTTQFGNSTQTTFYNQNGSYGGNAQTFRTGTGTQTTFYNQNGAYGGSAQNILTIVINVLFIIISPPTTVIFHD